MHSRQIILQPFVSPSKLSHSRATNHAHHNTLSRLHGSKRRDITKPEDVIIYNDALDDVRRSESNRNPCALKNFNPLMYRVMNRSVYCARDPRRDNGPKNGT